MSSRAARGGDELESLLDHYFELIEIPEGNRSGHWLEMLTEVGVGLKQLGPYLHDQVEGYVKFIRAELESRQHGRGPPVRLLIQRLDSIKWPEDQLLFQPEPDTSQSAAAVVETNPQSGPPSYNTAVHQPSYSPTADSPILRHDATTAFTQRQLRHSSSSFTEEDVHDEGNTLINAYFELLEVPDENRQDSWRADMQRIANRLDRLGSAAAGLAITVVDIQRLIQQSRSATHSSFSTQDLLQSLQPDLQPTRQPLEPSKQQHDMPEYEAAASIEATPSSYEAPCVSGPVGYRPPVSGEDLCNAYWELLEATQDSSWRVNMEALATQLEAFEDDQLSVTADQVRSTLAQSSAPAFEDPSELASRLNVEQTPLDQLAQMFLQHDRRFLAEQLSAAFDDLEDAVHLVECHAQSKPMSSLDKLVEMFPQHDRSLLSAQLHAAFGDVDDAIHLIQRYEHSQQLAETVCQGPALEPEHESEPEPEPEPRRRQDKYSTMRHLPSSVPLKFHSGGTVPPTRWATPPGLDVTPSLAEVEDETQHRHWHSQINESAIRFKLTLLQRIFPHHSPGLLRKILEDNNYEVEASAAVLLEDDTAPREVHATGPVIPTATAVQPATHASPTMSRRELATAMTQSDPGQMSVEDWKEKRERYRSQLAQAARSGKSPGLAAHLREQIAHCNTQLRVAASHQATATVKAHNDADTIHRRLDLHGLQVKEALEKVEQLLQWHKQRRARLTGPDTLRHVEIITGAGRHSVNGRARLRPELERWLNSRGYRYTLINEGALRVALSSL
eukprot:m.198236 g.198236  ORF g.198236 m.198236 type:complete len:786 (-) comp17038_c0_seq2:2246-4603(-)